MTGAELPGGNDARFLKDASKPAVLIVDDDAIKRSALKAALAPLGLDVIEADSGVDGAQKADGPECRRHPARRHDADHERVRDRSADPQAASSEMTPIIFITAAAGTRFQTTTDSPKVRSTSSSPRSIPVSSAPKFRCSSICSPTLSNWLPEAHEVEISEHHLRMVTDVAPIGIFRTDAQYRYVYTNPRWTEITGMTSREAQGHDLDIILVLGQRSTLRAELDDPAREGADVSYRFQIPGEVPRMGIITVASIPDADGEVVGLIGTVADITAEAEAEAVMVEAHDTATLASQLKSDFLANMSHEIRTPMNGVLGMTELLLDTGLDSHQRDYAETVRSSGEALLTIVDDVLDFSKMEAGMLHVERRRLPRSSRSLRTWWICWRPLHRLSSSNSSRSWRPRFLGSSRGMPGACARYSSTSWGMPSSSLRSVRWSSGYQRIHPHQRLRTPRCASSIRDTGDGIHPDKLESIFQPFVQADTSTSRRHGGTGLGLAICGQLVTLMHGEYGVTSLLLEGSTFWFTIRGNATTPTSPECAQTVDARIKGLRVLVADDNAAQRAALSESLGTWGLTVTTATDRESALEFFRDAHSEGRPFAMALLDRSMPGMCDLDLEHSLRRDIRESTAVVSMVGLGDGYNVGDAESDGFRALLSKPIHLDHLLACLSAALGSSDSDEAPGQVAAGPDLVGPLQHGWILLAEDNLTNQKVAEAVLTGAGYLVDTVSQGEAAVEAARTRDYDAILMDCQMPGMNGYQATAAIRTQEGSRRRTPIIALTAGARREDHDRCLAAGMDNYLSKPVKHDTLLALIASLVHRGEGTRSDPLGIDPGASKLHPPPEEGPHRAFARRISDSATPRPPMLDPSMLDPVVLDPVVLDPVVLDQLDELGEATGGNLVDELVIQFLADAELHVLALQQACAEADADALTRSAHTLSGSTASLGAIELATSVRHDCVATESARADPRWIGPRPSREGAGTSSGGIRCQGGEPMNILAVDDDRTSLIITQRALQRLGHECHIATDGIAAWTLTSSTPRTSSSVTGPCPGCPASSSVAMSAPTNPATTHTSYWSLATDTQATSWTG